MVICSHCEKSQCGRRYYVLSYRLGSSCSMEVFDWAFQRSCVESGLFVKFYSVLPSSFSDETKLIHAEIVGHGGSVSSLLPVNLFGAPVFPGELVGVSCDVAKRALLNSFRKVHESGIYPISQSFDGYGFCRR